MALNWNAFLTDEGLTLPDEQWADFSQTAAASAPLSAMPKPTPGRKPGPGPDELNGFDHFMNGPSFDDNLFNPNDYFLSDYEVLQPFGDTLAGETTSESSPEPTSGISLTGPFTQTETPLSHTPASTATGPDQSPQMSQLQHQQHHHHQQQRPGVQRAQSYPNPQYESMFPPPLEPSYAEDMTYLNGRAGALHSSKPHGAPEKEREPDTTHKRNKNNPDILSACWTSPLCPNHDQDGPPPNPSSCGGGCAPFLFAEETPGLPSLMPPEPQEVIAEEGVVEIQPRPKKRSESTSSSEPTGRQFRNPSATSAYNEVPARLKSETTENSPQQPPEPSPAEDAKPKSRRRLPHNQVERKYRESLNTQLESLRRVVPALQQNSRVCDGADIEDLPAPSKPSKAVILASATAYIKQVEKENKSMQEENAMLRARIKALQALVKCDDCSLMQYVMDLKINNHNHPPKCAPPV